MPEQPHRLSCPSSAADTPRPLQHLSALLPLIDFSLRSAKLPLPSIAADARRLHQRMARTLAGTIAPHLLVTGRPGVGKTTLVQQLARQAADGAIPSLTGCRSLWLDCQSVGPEDSRACLESIFAAIQELPPPLLLILDGLALLLKRPHGGSNKLLLRTVQVTPEPEALP